MGEKITHDTEFNKESVKNMSKNISIPFGLLISKLIKMRNEKHEWLKDKQSRNLESETQINSQNEQLASQKFNEIFDRISKICKENTPRDRNTSSDNEPFRYNDGSTIIDLSVTDDDEQQEIYIDKHDWDHTSTYMLKKIKTWEFQLSGLDNNKRNTVNNLTPEELLNDILPIIEKRIDEAENYQKQKRINKIKKANLLIQSQDEKEADNLLKSVIQEI